MFCTYTVEEITKNGVCPPPPTGALSLREESTQTHKEQISKKRRKNVIKSVKVIETDGKCDGRNLQKEMDVS